jgi:hypothetical protein
MVPERTVAVLAAAVAVSLVPVLPPACAPSEVLSTGVSVTVIAMSPESPTSLSLGAPLRMPVVESKVAHAGLDAMLYITGPVSSASFG